MGMMLVVLLFAISAFANSDSAKKPQTQGAQFSELMIQLEDDEVTAGRKASLIRSLSEKELETFILESAKWIPAESGFALGRWIRSIDILSRNKKFRPSDAKAVLALLSKQQRGFGLEGKMRSLSLRLKAKAGDFSSELVKNELLFLADAKVPSADRLSTLGALTDGMQEAGVKPQVSDLEKLLQNDVYEIRMHAVDWFRILEYPEKEGYRFLKAAIKVNPYQVRERVYRYLASLSDKDFLATYKESAGAKNGISCVLDKSEVTRKLCETLEARAAQLGKKEAP